MMRLRLHITKGAEIRYISHLDYARAMERAIRRAHLPAAYSEGFHPHMKLSFASALALGATSAAEYADVEMNAMPAIDAVMKDLAAQLPPGIQLLDGRYFEGPAVSLMAAVNLAAYTIKAPLLPGGNDGLLREAVEKLNQAENAAFIRVSPKGKKTVDIKEYLALPVQGEERDGQAVLQADVHITPGGSIKPSELLEVLIRDFALPAVGEEVDIHRRGLYICKDAIRLSPLEYGRGRK